MSKLQITDSQKKIVEEFRNERHINSSISDETLQVLYDQAAYYLNHLVEGANAINFDTDFNARRLLKIHMWYDHYGALDDFKIRYRGDLYASQIERL